MLTSRSGATNSKRKRRFDSAAVASVQRRPSDEQRFRLDFLPFVERTVQPYGVSIDGIRR
jgi:hypothetical protein